MHIRRLEPTDDRERFSSGVEALDTFLRTRAVAHQRNGASVTYVVAEGSEIYGYATLTPTTMERDFLAKKARRNRPAELPALLLGRLATSIDHQKKGVAKELLRYAMTLALGMQDTVGCVALIVDAKPEAVGFYEKFGFAPFPTATLNRKMLLPCDSIRKAQSR